MPRAWSWSAARLAEFRNIRVTVPPAPDGRSADHGEERGAALAYVLALLVIIGLLVGMVWRIIRTDNTVAALDHWDAQAHLLSASGLDYALARIGPPGSKQDLAYATEGVNYRLNDSNLVFDLTVRTRGLFARARSTGRTRLPGPGRYQVQSALLGEALDLGSLPAVCLMNHEGNMVLAGAAQVTGPVLLWRGDVRKATDYNVRWKGVGGHSGPVWDSTSLAWKKVRPDFQRAATWIKVQESLLADRNFGKDPDYDSGSVKDLLLPDSAKIADTILTDTRIIARRSLRIGPGAHLRDCKIISNHIIIDTNSQLQRTLVFAGRNLEVTGGTIQGGQFLAVDTLRIASAVPLLDNPVFYAQGRIVNSGKPDSAMIGALIIEKANGSGLFLAAMENRPAFDQEVRLIVKPNVNLTGLIYCGGFAQVEGEVRGSLICYNLKFEYRGTIWLGHLKDAHVTAFAGKKVVPAPLLFHEFSPVAFGRQGP